MSGDYRWLISPGNTWSSRPATICRHLKFNKLSHHYLLISSWINFQNLQILAHHRSDRPFDVRCRVETGHWSLSNIIAMQQSEVLCCAGVEIQHFYSYSESLKAEPSTKAELLIYVFCFKRSLVAPCSCFKKVLIQRFMKLLISVYYLTLQSTEDQLPQRIYLMTDQT